eukprot:7331738-Alexandrium_andersonii.AAC.1
MSASLVGSEMCIRDSFETTRMSGRDANCGIGGMRASSSESAGAPAARRFSKSANHQCFSCNGRKTRQARTKTSNIASLVPSTTHPSGGTALAMRCKRFGRWT